MMLLNQHESGSPWCQNTSVPLYHSGTNKVFRNTTSFYHSPWCSNSKGQVDRSTTTGVVACYYVQHKVCFLCSPASSPLASFFTHSAELKEFDDARRLHFANIHHLFFIFEYLFILYFFFFFIIIQRSQQKFFGKTVIVADRKKKTVWNPMW